MTCFATFLENERRICGKSMFALEDGEVYNVSLTLLMKLLYELSDEIAPIVDAVRFLPCANDLIARRR